jgi:hypothetical protein
MTSKDLQEHQVQLSARLKEISAERGQIIRKLKAIKILLEGLDNRQGNKPERPGVKVLTKVRGETILSPVHSSSRLAGAAPRSGLIEIVKKTALKQPGSFDSVRLLEVLRAEHPELGLKETKHISSPLSDLVKKKVLVLERKRAGSKPNIYRAANA